MITCGLQIKVDFDEAGKERIEIALHTLDDLYKEIDKCGLDVDSYLSITETIYLLKRILRGECL